MIKNNIKSILTSEIAEIIYVIISTILMVIGYIFLFGTNDPLILTISLLSIIGGFPFLPIAIFQSKFEDYRKKENKKNK